MQARVLARTGLAFQMSAFYRSPTISGLVAGAARDDIARAVADAAAPVAPDVGTHREAGAKSIRNVILTGASGFFGIHLLSELTRQVDRVFCLQRCDTARAGHARLEREARTAGLAIDFTHMEVVQADLTLPQAGLSDADWHRLAGEGDAVWHCGAHVHHLLGYSSLKAANVDSTENLLRLAVTTRRKPFCFVSTMSVPLMLEGVASAEEQVGTERPASDNGYLLGKWVSEQRVAAYARAAGLPVTIARIGNVTGHSKSGYSNYRNNHFWLFNQSCVQFGAYPDNGQMIEMTPVDVLARALGALALHPRAGLHVANLQNPARIGQR